jgi:ATP-dependent DNA ligase
VAIRRAAQARQASPPRNSVVKPSLVVGDGFDLPLRTAPMGAKSAERLPANDGLWQYEPKWDGFRCLAFKARNVVELRAKSGKSLDRYLPEIVAPGGCSRWSAERTNGSRYDPN